MGMAMLSRDGLVFRSSAYISIKRTWRGYHLQEAMNLNRTTRVYQDIQAGPSTAPFIYTGNPESHNVTPGPILPSDIRYGFDQWQASTRASLLSPDLHREEIGFEEYNIERNRIDSERIKGWGNRLREESPPNSPASQNEQPTEYDEHIPWKPPRAMVFVNALWFLSLILNVAVAFIAMLSKEWLAKLLANHNGSHLTQAWHRQKVWDKIYQWRLPVFQLLIRDIDYVVVLFSIGLAIFLWDLGSAAVAVPVTIVVALMIIICILFTIFPFVDGYSPFSTSTSSILFAFRNVDPHAIPDDLESRLDPLILRILQRIIASGDNLQAVNLMSKLLSSFIHTNDSQNLLERSRIWSVIRTRFHALRPYDLQFDASAGLYAQFLLALERFRCNTGYETTSFVERVCLLLWAVQGYNRRRLYKSKFKTGVTSTGPRSGIPLP
ncbi:hypothetical protein AG1IA_06597 [Rhizoctonia solani AG-1 IA]|uniref:DUF6535 domain-containing protein n=1 Tax=Thanatephorus cucumeris (strain AG1-IA) TaxID=983506 RepID=L8WN43_THACA|nr:hypothetical protein AG1IA_06597 [Rhizoctonia solani AG-1 IA]